MSYELIWTPKSLQRLKELDKKTALRIVEKLESAKEFPHHFFTKLTEVESWRMRVGDYRVICFIDENKKKLVVETIGHRKKIYK
ncbi:MAG: type II toxin-antitoxin system RelE/ParE family toxin [Candidatus Micrarchaeota archaeon]